MTIPLLALLVIPGCGGSGHAWKGTWSGDREGLILPDKDDDVIARALKRVEIKLLGDGRFEMTEMGIPLKGSYSLNGDVAKLKIRSRFDREVDPNMPELILTWQADGSILYEDPGGNYPEPVKMTKEPETNPESNP